MKKTNLEENLDNTGVKRVFKLFFMAFIQTCLVSCNVVFLVNGNIAFVLLTSFGVAYTWTNNVQKIAFGHEKDRFAYCFGAMLGNCVGYYIAKYLQTFL